MSTSPPPRIRLAFRSPVKLLTDRFPRLRRAQGLVEFALILPALLMVLFVIIDVARTFQAYLVVDNAARMAMRFAVTGDFDTSHCVDLDGPPPDPCDGDERLAEEDAARMQTVYDVV